MHWWRQKWVISLIGMLALSVLIWFGGPYLAIAGREILAGEVTRLLLIMLLILGWGVNNLRLSRQAQQRHEKIADELQQPESGERPAEGAEASEVTLLGERFRDAIAVLRRSSGSRYGKHYLYELPWYIIIGPPGAGKTTALANSGLDFPLENQFGRGAIQGMGGTRHCDWWFTDQAVLIDTAGRYTTQDSSATADAKAWHGFLGLLKKHRKRRPINGVLVALSVEALLNPAEPERSRHVDAIRTRLQELKTHLGMNFPVYLLLTKADLIPGFNAYFEMLGRSERNQVWGMTFPDKLAEGESYQALFNAEYELLASRLHDGLLGQFQRETRSTRRAQILDFPAHFEQLKPRLAECIGRVFSESRFHDSYLLRGVYFTSGTQEGAPMQRMMHQLAGQMGFGGDALAPAENQGRSYFLGDLFRHVVFPEAELAGADRRYERQLNRLRGLGYVATLGGATAATVVWATSYGLNDSRLNRAASLVETYQEQRALENGEQPTPQQVVAGLAPLLSLQDLYQPEQESWNLKAGLYQGHRVQQHAKAEYERALRRDFLPALQQYLGDALRQQDLPLDYLHQGLKAYLMLSLPQRLDKDFVAEWLRALWQNQLADQPQQREALQQHLARLLALEWPALEADADLVKHSRQQLRQQPVWQQLYTALQARAREQGAQEYRFDRRLGSGIHNVFAGEFQAIPWFYTAPGYEDFFKPQQENLLAELAEDSWVVGPRGEAMGDQALAEVQARIEKRYLEDYIHHWQSALSALQLQDTHSLQEHVRLLSDLLAGGSPLRRVLDEAAVHTRLTRPQMDVDALKEKAAGTGKLARVVSPKAGKLSRIAGLAGRSRLVQLPENPATLVDQRFAPLHDLMSTESGDSSQYERVNAALTELQFYLEGITSAGDTAQSAFDAAVARMQNGRSDPIGRLKLEARHLPPPVQRWVTALTDRAWSHTLGAARSHLAREYDASVRAFYERSLAGRYPLDKSAQVEVTLADFTEFFGPDGIEQRFFQSYLAPFVDTRRSPWRAVGVDGQSLGLSRKTLAGFEQARRIRRAFFAEGEQPRVDFKLRATYLDANINRFTLNLLGQRLEYRHGPARSRELTWPALDDREQVRYLFEDHYGVQYTGQVSGIWALYRFLDRFPLQPTDYGDRYRLTITDQQRKAVYELRAASTRNPFAADDLGRFQLPARL